MRLTGTSSRRTQFRRNPHWPDTYCCRPSPVNFAAIAPYLGGAVCRIAAHDMVERSVAGRVLMPARKGW